MVVTAKTVVLHNFELVDLIVVWEWWSFAIWVERNSTRQLRLSWREKMRITFRYPFRRQQLGAK